MEGQAAVIDVTCNGAGCQPAVSPGGEFIAGGQGVDSCFGDSGGPVYLDSRATTASCWPAWCRAALDDAVTPCGDGGIYVRPDDLIDWIELAAGEPIARATCTAPPVEDPSDDGDDGDDGVPGDDGGDGASSDDGGLDESGPGGTVIGGCSAGGDGGSAALALLLLAALVRLQRSATPTCRSSRPRPSAAAWPCCRRG